MKMSMKHIGAGLAVAVLCGLLVPGDSFAKERRHQGGKHRKGWTRMERVVKALDLSKDQQENLKALWEKKGKTLKPLQKQRGEQLRELKGFLKSEPNDARLTAKLNALNRTQEKIDRAEQGHRKSVRAILTPTQQAKFVLRIARRAERWQTHDGWKGHEGRKGRRDKRSWRCGDHK